VSDEKAAQIAIMASVIYASLILGLPRTPELRRRAREQAITEALLLWKEVVVSPG
jgi:hypothetical protein